MARPPVALDMCCGSRMLWFDREHTSTVFGDRRIETLVVADRSHGRADGKRSVRIEPDVACDFRSLPFADQTFDLVVFDPPHLIRAGRGSWMAAKYGKLGRDWRSDLQRGFAEGFRVLKASGTLVFKWSENQVPIREVLALSPQPPLFGNTAGKRAGTHWMIFLNQVAA